MKRTVDISELIEFDIRTGNFKTIDTSESLPRDISQELEKVRKNLGLRLFIQGIDDPEHFVRSFYENHGYLVTRMPYFQFDGSYKFFEKYKVHLSDICQRFIQANYTISKGAYCKSIDELLHKAGVPDFLVIKIDGNMVLDLFFVEVKCNKDSLRYEQLFWIFSSNVPSRIVYVRPDKLEL